MPWVYMIKNKGDRIYVGVSKRPAERLREHNRKLGSNFTKSNPSFRIVFTEEYPDFLSARKREVQLKKWSRAKKEVLAKKYAQGLETKI